MCLVQTYNLLSRVFSANIQPSIAFYRLHLVLTDSLIAFYCIRLVLTYSLIAFYCIRLVLTDSLIAFYCIRLVLTVIYRLRLVQTDFHRPFERI